MATTNSANTPKQKRRNSEKRKEKSRDAARCRRSKESEIFADLSEILPLPCSVSSHLDKASIMRLSIAYLRARNLFGSGSGCGRLKEEDDVLENRRLDNLVPKLLEGFLLIISTDGDIVYVTEDVSQHLGLPQVDLIGQSVYEYSHPCDHSEVKEALTSRTDDENNLKSLFLRFKCTLTNKGRSVNLKSATYKVIHCTGRFVSRNKTREGGYLVLFGEPIPHPSNIEGSLDCHTFLTKHSLDMKYIFVDDKVTQFLGYQPDQLEGKSAFDFYHVLDGDAVLKHYKTMVAKGQSQTAAYRFLALHGGYVWVQTQSTVIYGSRDARPQAVVCLHKVLSEIEEPDQILSVVQASSPARAAKISITEDPAKNPVKVEEKLATTTSTSKMFAPRTADMDKGYLIVSEATGGTAFKEEPEDLTHLAPKAGDICIPLDIPFFSPMEDLYQDLHLSAGMMDCLPLTGFDFSAAAVDHAVDQSGPYPSEALASDQDGAVSVTASLFSKDPFFFVNKDDVCGSSEHSMSELFSPLAAKTPETYEEYIGGLPDPPKLEIPCPEDKIDPVETFLTNGMDLSSPNLRETRVSLEDFGSVGIGSRIETPTTGIEIDEEEDFNFRAPFIPMGDSDLPLFSCDDFLEDLKSGTLNLPINSTLNGESDPDTTARVSQTTWSLLSLLNGPSASSSDCSSLNNKARDSKKRQHWQEEEGPDFTTRLPKRPKEEMRVAAKQPDFQQPPRRSALGQDRSWNPGTSGKVGPQKAAAANFRGLIPPHQERQYLDNSSSLLALLKQPSSWSLLQPSLDPQQHYEHQKKKRKEGFINASNGEAVYPLLDLTSYDCEVNAPLQPATGLLQGEDLLKALDAGPLNVNMGN